MTLKNVNLQVNRDINKNEASDAGHSLMTNFWVAEEKDDIIFHQDTFG